MDITLKQEWIDRLGDRIELYLQRSDSINLWGTPTVGASYRLKELLKTVNDDIFSIIVDTNEISEITLENLYSNLNTKLSQINTKKNKELSHNPILLAQWYIDEITKKNRLIIVIDKIEHLSKLGAKSLLSLKSLRDNYIGKICFIFMSNRPISSMKKLIKEDTFIEFASQKEYVAPTYSIEESKNIVEKLCKKYKIKFTDEQKSAVSDFSIGCYGIIKQLFRMQEDLDEPVTTDQVLKNKKIVAKLSRIYKNFTNEEIKYLLDLCQNKTQDKDFESKFLQKSGILQNKGIPSPLLCTYLDSQGLKDNKSDQSSKQNPKKEAKKKEAKNSKNLRIDFESGEIFIDDKLQNDLLSDTELSVLKYMKENERSFTKREGIAEAMWGDESIEKYSDWAIDKCISRIRKKIKDTDRPYKVLVTIKGKGFKLYY